MKVEINPFSCSFSKTSYTFQPEILDSFIMLWRVEVPKRSKAKYTFFSDSVNPISFKSGSNSFIGTLKGELVFKYYPAAIPDMTNIETKIQESWIKKAYQQEWATMGNNLVAAGTSLGITAAVTHLAQKYANIRSDEALILTATITDLSSYYVTLFG